MACPIIDNRAFLNRILTGKKLQIKRFQIPVKGLNPYHVVVLM
jgi:hypothetical protein